MDCRATPAAKECGVAVNSVVDLVDERQDQPLSDRPLLEQMTPEERVRFVQAVAAWFLESVLDDLAREHTRRSA